MIKVAKMIWNGSAHGTLVYIPLEQYLEECCQNAPEGWFGFIEDWVNEGMNIQTEEEYERFLKKTNMRSFDYKSVNILYQSLKHSKYNELFEDDILRYIADMYGRDYFLRISYEIDINKPELDKWLTTKNLFKRNICGPNSDRDGFSLMDLLPYKYGQNAIRRELGFSSKW